MLLASRKVLQHGLHGKLALIKAKTGDCQKEDRNLSVHRLVHFCF